MSDPQLENGYIRIANELYQAIYSLNLSASELRVLLFIVYQTYGYNKKKRRLSYLYIANGIGASKETVKKSIKKLIEKNIIFAESEYQNEPKIMGINKKYSQWRVVQMYPTKGYKMTGQNIPHTGVQTYPTEGYKFTTNTIQNNNTEKTRQSSRQLPPNLDEILEYCAERNYTFDAEKFFLSYEAVGWKSRGNKITNWKALCDVWQKTEREKQDDDPELDVWGNPIKKDEWQ